MRFSALLIGVLVVVQGVVGLAVPDVFVSSIRFVQAPPVIYLVAILRVAFGVVLLRAAAGSRAPRFLRVFGCVIVVGGLLTPFVGIWAGQHILRWGSEGGPSLVRVFAGSSLTLGVLVFYALVRRRPGS